MKSRTYLLLALIVCSFSACEVNDPVTPGNNATSALDSQLNDAAQLNVQSARNSLLQAQTQYFQFNASLLNVSTDVSAYRKLVSEMLPSMLSAANSLTVTASSDTEVSQLKADFQELFSDVMAQAIQGINNNLNLYQGILETARPLDESGSASTPGEALSQLTDLFQATEYTERFAAQLAQFQGLLSNASSVLTGIRNQQSVVINGVLRVSEQVQDTQALEQSYNILVQSLTRPELLASLGRLAQQTFGAGRVALRQSELTPTQPDSSLVQMVIQESTDRYRLIRINEGRLVNEVIVDSRGLSASDLLYQSNVVVIPSPRP